MERASHRSLDLSTARRAPKVLLHDHLDGGLRPTTVIALASEVGYRELPTPDPDELAGRFPARRARSRSPRLPSGTGTKAWSASTSPGLRPGTRRPGTSTPSTSSPTRTSTS